MKRLYLVFLSLYVSVLYSSYDPDANIGFIASNRIITNLADQNKIGVKEKLIKQSVVRPFTEEEKREICMSNLIFLEKRQLNDWIEEKLLFRDKLFEEYRKKLSKIEEMEIEFRIPILVAPLMDLSSDSDIE